MNITSRQQKCFCLQPLNPPLIKAPLKKCSDLGWGSRGGGGGGGGGGGRRCRKRWAYLRKNPDYAPAKA